MGLEKKMDDDNTSNTATLSAIKEESDDDELNEKESATTTKQTETITTIAPKIEEIEQDKEEPITIDFSEMENVPYEPMSPSSFYDPCKNISQYQIPREIQMESAMNYSQLLQTIPKNIMDYATTKLSS